MNVLSLFSGIGGLDLGLERAGMTIAGQVELDPWCRKILAKHWPEVPRHDDVRTCAGWWGDRAVDLVCGGFPCQPVSLAGKGLAQADSRWLWPAFAQVIRSLRPRFVLVENVPGLLGRGMGDVLGDLAELGYDAEWDCVPAAFVGAPHIRNRVWIVAYPQRSGRVGANGDQREHDATRRPGRPAADDVRVFGQASSQPGVLADAAGSRRETGPCGTGEPARHDARRPRPDGLGSSLADSVGQGLAQRQSQPGDDGAELAPAERGSHGAGDVADSDGRRLAQQQERHSRPQPRIFTPPLRHDALRRDPHAADTGREPLGRTPESRRERGHWVTEPAVRGVAPGLSDGLDGDINAGQGMGAEQDVTDGGHLRALWDQIATAPSPQRPRPDEQLARELADALRGLPHPLALAARQEGLAAASRFVHGLRQACEAIGAVRDPSDPLAPVWQSLSGEAQDWVFLGACRGTWHAEWPGVPRVAHGVPDRVDRLRGLGNAVVPQVAEHIGRLVLAAAQ